MPGRYYVQYFNYEYQRTGTLSEGCYKASRNQVSIETTPFDSFDYRLVLPPYTRKLVEK